MGFFLVVWTSNFSDRMGNLSMFCFLFLLFGLIVCVPFFFLALDECISERIDRIAG